MAEGRPESRQETHIAGRWGHRTPVLLLSIAKDWLIADLTIGYIAGMISQGLNALSKWTDLPPLFNEGINL